ncbi:MAG: alpha-2-macroglobulin family protein [Hyphomicrobiales bacterium]|nr:alpha-2-macroglobulin family protein [Hyphomicrobiales bacterium]
MRTWSFVAAFAVSLFCATPVFADSDFVQDDLATGVTRLPALVRKEAGGLIKRPAAQLESDGLSALSHGDARRALDLFGAAIALDEKNATSWLGYAEAAIAIEPRDSSERYTLRGRVLAAAYGAYQRVSNKKDKARALVLLGRTFVDLGRWRPALNAYRASLDSDDNADVRKTYEDLRKEHGFRVVDYKVDSDADQPRICFEFSDPLRAGKIDFSPFVAVSGNANTSVTLEADAQLCVDGLKHGEHYAIVLREGLPSAVDEPLQKSLDYEIYVRDRSPLVRFTGKNYVLPRIGQEGIPLVSINTSKIDVAISRIGDRNLLSTLRSEDFLNQIAAYRAGQIADQDGVKVWSGSIDAKPILNAEVTTAFPVLDAVGKLEPGVYVMTAWPDGASDDDYGSRATQWFVVSDFGLTAFSGTDGVHVLVKSLASAAPLSGVELRLIAKNNEVLDTKSTDATGHAHFEAGLARGTGGMAPSLVVAADGKGDYGFLDISVNGFDLTDRGVKGRLVRTALDAFLFTERGVYRSGETVFLTALLRDAKAEVVQGLPLTIVIRRPDGVEYKRVKLDDQGLGGRSLMLPLLSDAQHGTWRIEAYADPKSDSIGETSFLVEDYVPQKLEVSLSPSEKVLLAGEPARIKVDARFLYGAPGAGLDVTGNVTIEPLEGNLPGLEGYAVGLQDERFENQSKALEEGNTTDAKGHADITVDMEDVAAPRPLEAKITLTVGEPGGRSLDRTVSLPIRPSHALIGVKKLFNDEQLTENSSAKFELIAVDEKGVRAARKDVSWTLSEVHRSYQWFRRDGTWQFEPLTTTRKVRDGRLDLAAGAPSTVDVPVKYGSYRLDVRSADGTAQTAVSFYAGWGGGTTADTPDTLELTLDRHEYNSGESAKVHFSTKTAGTATLAVVSEGVHAMKTIDVRAGDNDVEMPVEAGWGSGAYMVALVHRPLDIAAKRLPGRALGVAWFGIDKNAHTLGVELSPPDKTRPRGRFDIPVKLVGLQPGEEAYVTVAAVDVGILNLTNYELPNPQQYFFGQRQLGAEIRDLYGFLIDGMQGEKGAIRSGGDSGGGLKADTPTQPPLARYSGIVKVGPDGAANVSFDLPAFNGTVRVMAAAWSKTRVAQASKDVIVRDPVVAEATLPRFLNFGDETRFNISIDNVEAPAGDFSIDVDAHGPVAVPTTAAHAKIKLAEHERKSIQIPVTASGIGTGLVDVTLAGAGGSFRQSLAVKVEPGRPEVYHRIVRPMPPQASLTVSKDLLHEFLPGTGSVGVSVAPLVAIDVAALLQALDRYPYGCTEQTVSRAMPLLYVNQLASAERLGLDPDLDNRIKTAIERVLSRQSSDGSFGLWSQESSEDIWLDAFTADFLTRARERNFEVPQLALQSALDRLRNFVKNGEPTAERADGFAYAAYVLARNHRPISSDLRYATDTKLDVFKSPFARAQLAAALALLGDRGRSQSAFASAITLLRGEKDTGLWRPDYGSRLRDGAGMLALAVETGLPRDELVKVSAVMDDARSSRLYTSTQENAWMVLAAQALASTATELTVKVNDADRKGNFNARYSDESLGGKPITVQNTSDLPAQSILTVSGNPLVQDPAANQGYAVAREYYKLDGSRADLSKVKQNDRLVVVLKVTEPVAKYARLLIVDPLPAGLEIDNPKLMDSDQLAGLDWLKQDVEAKTAEYRDDRFVVAVDRSPDQPANFTFAYMVRAVSPGHYVHPPTTVEDMYRPERYGRTAYGSFDVAPAK